MIPWSDAERVGGDREAARDDAREEAELRALFERRARVLAGPPVPPLGRLLGAARVHERPARRARVAAGVALAAACFAAALYGHRGGGGCVDVAQARAEVGVDGGAPAQGMRGALASWGWRPDDVMCSADGARPMRQDDALACFSPRAVTAAFTPAEASRARVASDSAPSCRVDDP